MLRGVVSIDRGQVERLHGVMMDGKQTYLSPADLANVLKNMSCISAISPNTHVSPV